jgi:hypothetical protein
VFCQYLACSLNSRNIAKNLAGNDREMTKTVEIITEESAKISQFAQLSASTDSRSGAVYESSASENWFRESFGDGSQS